MLRRTFLLGAAAAASRGEDRIRIGFLGAGHSHTIAKLVLVRKSPDWDLAGVWEPSPEIRASIEKAGFPVVAREKLLGDPAVRVISVGSENQTHFEYARMALEAGKHVHLEKPPAARKGELEILLDIARRKKLLVQMGYMWRYHPGVQAALEAARNGWLGDVFMVRGTINTTGSPRQRAEWAQFPGGQMFELGGHLIDPIVRLMGKPVRITPFLRSHGPQNDKLADNNLAVFEWPKALGVVFSSNLQPGATAHRALEIFGQNGAAVLRPIEPPTLIIDVQKSAGPYKAGATRVDLPPFQRYVADYEDLARCVRAGKPLSITHEEDLNVQETLLRASGMWT